MNTVIITDKMLHGGSAAAKIDGKTVFIEGALPQEELSISITLDKKDYSVARLEKVLTPSPYRTVPLCPLYGICGGCNLMHANDEYQKSLRVSILKNSFERAGLEQSIVLVSGKPLGYRNRFQFEEHGLKSAKSNTIIPIPRCPVADETINEFLQHEKTLGRVKVFGSHLLCKQTVNSKEYVFAQEIEKQIHKEQFLRGKKIKSGGKRKIYEGTTIQENHEATIKLCNKELSFNVLGFFQSNIEMLEKTAGLIKQHLPQGLQVLDMYGGVGTLSSLCADNAKHITLVEHNRDAVVYAEKNLAGIPHTSYGLSGAQWAKSAGNTHFDAVIIDPPRSGMEKEVRDYLAQSNIPLIISLSCDPATHSRDCASLVKAGYSIEHLYALDYYPQTSHLESLAICIKN